MAILKEIAERDRYLHDRYQSRLSVNPALDRSLVSFQANKQRASFRWFKYKEGFSAPLVHYLLEQTLVKSGTVLDPFADSGTTLFVSSSRGLDAVGIELLPVGVEFIEIRKLLAEHAGSGLLDQLHEWSLSKPWTSWNTSMQFPHLRITAGAFSPENEKALSQFLSWAKDPKNPLAARVVKFAAMSILEAISYTRKDGQYLRWDQRSGRRPGANPFDKSHISAFDSALVAKLRETLADLSGTG